MHTASITAEIERAVSDLRPLGDADFYVSYVNANDVPVKRRVLVGVEVVDNVTLAERRAA